MATEVQIPELGESIKQAVLLKWHKTDGQAVGADEAIAELETDKANVDVRSPVSGVLRPMRKEGDSVAVGEVIARIEEGIGAAASPKPSAAPAALTGGLDDLSPAVRAMVVESGLDPKSIPATGPGGRITKQDVQTYLSARAAKAAPAPKAAAPTPQMQSIQADTTRRASSPVPAPAGVDGVRREPMSKIRKRIAQTMVAAQQTAAILTTFNEIDMTAVLELRARHKERFQEIHGVGLGLMSFFARGIVLALREFPRVNASIEGDDVVYHDFVHLGIAVSTDRGLAVPVLRNVQAMGFARIESEIKRLAAATREGKLDISELSGATFTVTNGGVFGSLLSTPILTPPQSGILGMHAIQRRPVAVNEKVEIRAMMYVALSYDHRLVDGRESVTFLVRLKQLLEDPSRLMLEI